MTNKNMIFTMMFLLPSTALALPISNTSNQNIKTTIEDYAVYAGQDPESPFQKQTTKSIEAFNPNDPAIGRQTVQYGGHSANDIVAEKHNCMTISGGDEGGTCFQFINGNGGAWTHRSGSGLTDAVNMELNSYASSPLDVIGGNTPSADGIIYHVAFSSNGAIISPKLSDKEKQLFRSRISLFTNVANGMAGTESNDYSGSDNIDLPNYYQGYVSTVANDDNNNTTIVTVENYYYPSASAPDSIQGQYIWRTITNPSPYPYPKTATWSQQISSSANIGGNSLKFTGIFTPASVQNGVDSCKRWTCTVSGNGLQAGTIITSSKYDDKSNITTIELSNSLTNTVDSGAIIYIDVYDKENGRNFFPGNMLNDTLDINLTYKSKSGERKINTNHHSYNEPALFIGQTVKDFNEYTLQTNNQPKDTITRAHDNEYDFWMKGADHDGQLESRGMTLVWQGQHHLATGSWMLRLAGFNIQPTGLWVDGVMDKGIELKSDTGLFAFKQISPENKEVGTATTSLMLGTVGSSSRFGQLGWYASEDGSSNGSFHLGLSASNSNVMAYNVDPRCKSNDIQPNPVPCDIAGQIVFDPNDYIGGIALGIGQGSNYKSGIVVDANANVVVPKDVRVNGNVIVGGQGGSVGIKSGTGSRTSYATIDENGNFYVVPDRGTSGGGIRNYWYNFGSLPTSATGTQFYCGDCYSSFRPSNSTETGIIVTWNGTHWIDGIGLPIKH